MGLGPWAHGLDFLGTWADFYTVVTLNSTGSDVKSGFELPLLEDAEVLGGGLAVIGLLLFFVR